VRHGFGSRRSERCRGRGPAQSDQEGKETADDRSAVEPTPVEPVLTAEVVSAPLPAPQPAKRLAGLSDLREAAKRRKAAMA
jgi:hypothetical protein